jgi:hypothetical protein
VTAEDRKKNRYHFDRHTPEYRHQFEAITAEMHGKCPVAWSDTYDGHWVAASHKAVFELARSAEYLSNDHDVNNEILQRACDEQRLAEPVTVRKSVAKVSG